MHARQKTHKDLMGKVMCRLCSKAVKSVAHVLAGRTALAQNKVAHAPRLITKYTNTNVFTAAAATYATATTIRNSHERSLECGILVTKEWKYGISTRRENLFLKSRLFSLISYTAALTQTTAGRESISSLVINSVILITFTFNKGVLLRKK